MVAVASNLSPESRRSDSRSFERAPVGCGSLVQATWGVVRVGRASDRGSDESEPPASAAISDAVRRWERDDRTLSRSAPGLVVLLSPNDGDPIVLRGTGFALWAALDPPQSTEELAVRLAAEFDANSATVRSDIEPVIARLRAAGVLRLGS
jgi:hypothetical protein